MMPEQFNSLEDTSPATAGADSTSSKFQTEAYDPGSILQNPSKALTDGASNILPKNSAELLAAIKQALGDSSRPETADNSKEAKTAKEAKEAKAEKADNSPEAKDKREAEQMAKQIGELIGKDGKVTDPEKMGKLLQEAWKKGLEEEMKNGGEKPLFLKELGKALGEQFKEKGMKASLSFNYDTNNPDGPTGSFSLITDKNDNKTAIEGRIGNGH